MCQPHSELQHATQRRRTRARHALFLVLVQPPQIAYELLRRAKHDVGREHRLVPDLKELAGPRARRADAQQKVVLHPRGQVRLLRGCASEIIVRPRGRRQEACGTNA
jgi:hypothetical protein